MVTFFSGSFSTLCASYKSEIFFRYTASFSKSCVPILSVPLSDYIDIGIFAEEDVEGVMKEKLLYLKKHKITSIDTKLTIIVDKKPIEVGVDPYNKLIDSQSDDNRKKI